jgi:hypothetical protein
MIHPDWCDLPIEFSVSVAENSGLLHLPVPGAQCRNSFTFSDEVLNAARSISKSSIAHADDRQVGTLA